MVVDLDFRYTHDTCIRQHDTDIITDLLCEYTDELKKHFIFETGDNFNVFVMEKPNVNRLSDGSLTKDGIHFMFNISVPYAIQKEIRNNMLKTSVEILESLPLINSMDSVFDEGISKGTTNWNLFGSRKPDNEAYGITQSYNMKYDVDSFQFNDYIFDNKDSNTISVRNKHHLFTLSKQGENAMGFKPISSPISVVDIHNQPKSISNQISQIESIKEAYSKERLSSIGDYKSGGWKRFTLAMCSTFGEDGKELWDTISKRGDGYNINGNEKVWLECCKMKDKVSPSKQLGMGSLMMWAREDNEELYNSVFNTSSINWNRLTHYTFALALEQKLLQGKASDKSKIVFTGKTKEMTGYIFNGTYWKELGLHNTEVKKKYFAEMYEEYLKEFMKVKTHFDEIKQAAILNGISSLDNVTQRNMILEALKTERYVDKIEWNTKRHLFAFEDCIWDLDKGEFTEPNPEDYLSWTCGYAYGDQNKDYKEKQNSFKNDYLNKVFEDSDMEQYMLNLLSSFLKQENPEEKAYFWLGRGRNSKGTLTKFMMEAMGEYFGELKLGFYTNYDKGEDSPNNNLFELRYARVCNTSEVGEDNLDPNKPQRFITQKFKMATGGDQMTARQPHQKEQIKFVMGHVLVQTNLMPMIVGIEKEENISLRERVVIVPFPFSFVDDDDLIASNPTMYRKRDNKVKEMMEDPEMKLGFIRLLLENYKNYKTNGLIEPSNVKQEKMNYFKESDKIGKWFDENIEENEETPTSKLDIKEDLLKAFWSVNSGSVIKQQNMIDYITLRYGKRKGKDGTGYYKNGGNHLLQGYKWIAKEEPQPLL